MPNGMTPQQFVAKWRNVELSERAASQEHFIDLCRLLGQPTPAEHDATGAEYTFEKGVAVTAGAYNPAGQLKPTTARTGPATGVDGLPGQSRRYRLAHGWRFQRSPAADEQVKAQ